MLGVLTLTLALVGCADNAASSAPDDSASVAPAPSATDTTATDLSAIDCATDDPEGLGPLTGAWNGSEGGVYYIRQVGDCVLWFGTELRDIEPGRTGQLGFANVASGRVVGTKIEVEFADLPLGNVLGGGGLTFVYSEANDQLVLIEQRGDWQPFGATVMTRIDAEASPDASPSESASP